MKALDEKAGADALTREQLADGIRALDEAAGGRFVSASPDVQQRCTKAIEGQPFFELVRSQCITTLYNNEMSFTLFGYPGSSWQLGGYLKRGFQDLTWLPSPPADASPPLTDIRQDAPARQKGDKVDKGEQGGNAGTAASAASSLSPSPSPMSHRYGG